MAFSTVHVGHSWGAGVKSRDQPPSAARKPRAVPILLGRAQLHTMANTLSALAAITGRRPEIAADLLAGWAEYLRSILGSRHPLVPLVSELELVRGFIGLQRARFGGRLRFEMVCQSSALDVLVPALVLHPLVENAVAHGIARRPGGGLVRVTGRLRRDTLYLAVSDDGPGFHRPFQAGAGWGMRDLRYRLSALWGPRARVRLLTRPGMGTLAAISMPAVWPPDRPCREPMQAVVEPPGSVS